jgi:hypothetical protein
MDEISKASENCKKRNFMAKYAVYMGVENSA